MSIKLIKSSNSYKLNIPQNVENKIRETCAQIWEDEWSGILFYNYEGSFTNNDIQFKCVDFYLMDIGNTTYTEFTESPEIISYMVENPELLDCQMALIHSHNNMATFFSGTDLNTLKEEGSQRNHFLSLIVNNKGNYTAAITRKVVSKTKAQSRNEYLTFNNEVTTNIEEFEDEVCTVEYFMLNVEIEKNFNIDDRIKELKKQKVEQNKAFVEHYPLSTYNHYKDSYSTPSKRYLPQQQTLFEHNTKEIVVDDMQDGDIPYNVEVDSKLIKSLVLQLITGSVIICNESRINPVEWVNKMSSLFEKRFGKGEEGLHSYNMWADTFIEYILYFTEIESKDEILPQEVSASILASNLVQEINTLPKNKYINELINILSTFII